MDGGGCGTIAADGDIDDSYFSDNDDENIYDDKNDDDSHGNNHNKNNNHNNDNSNNNNKDNNNKNHPLPNPNPKPQPTLQNKYRKMTEGLCDVLSDFGLISFLPMNIQDGEVR